MHDGAEIDIEASGVHAKVKGTATLADRASRSEDRLGGDTPGVQTFTAKAILFEEGNPGADASRPDRAHEAGGAAADDDEVVRNAGLWVLPALRAHQPIETIFNVL